MEDLVVLVPGFLGFARFGGFYYFADRLIAMLRASLEQPEGGALPVVPVTTLPTDSLRNRQRVLLENLASLSRAVDDAESIHLIGHSTGGVDAQLLACTQTIDGDPWPAKWNRVRGKIRTVITIAAPHYGTALADSRFALLGKNPFFNTAALIEQGRILYELLSLGPRYLLANAGFDGSVPNDVLKFFWQVVQNRDLIDDLKPEKMESLRSRLVPDPEIKLRCFVTGTSPRDDEARPSDPLFRDLYDLTKGPRNVTPAILERGRFLAEQVAKSPKRGRSELAINNPIAEMPEITPQLNDGVVNSARQIVNLHKEELAGFVVADHADVLGHYDRQDGLIRGRPFNAGLFHSGAGFGDPQFFELYRRVAQEILHSRAHVRFMRRARAARMAAARLARIDGGPAAPVAGAKPRRNRITKRAARRRKVPVSSSRWR